MPTPTYGLPLPEDTEALALVYAHQRALAQMIEDAFQGGEVTINANAGVGQTGNVYVTFPKPFAEPPKIMLTSQLINITFGHDQPSTTRVRVWIRNLTSSYQSAPVSWMAIGRPA